MRDEYDFSQAKRAKEVPHLARLQEETKCKQCKQGQTTFSC
jgi:hypothetical protein